MRKQKWYWIDSTNKSEHNEDESVVSPMPELSAPFIARLSKAKKRSNGEENSMLKRVCSNEHYAVESEVEWDRVYSRQTYVKHFQRWEGRVVKIYEDVFVARLIDSEGERMPRIAKIKKTLVNREDWDTFFHEGFEFEWLFKDVVTNGSFSRKNEIRFTPVTRYLPDEVEDFVKRRMSEFSYMLKEND